MEPWLHAVEIRVRGGVRILVGGPDSVKNRRIRQRFRTGFAA
jgi:hypothetical protein